MKKATIPVVIVLVLAIIFSFIYYEKYHDEPKESDYVGSVFIIQWEKYYPAHYETGMRYNIALKMSMPTEYFRKEYWDYCGYFMCEGGNIEDCFISETQEINSTIPMQYAFRPHSRRLVWRFWPQTERYHSDETYRPAK